MIISSLKNQKAFDLVNRHGIKKQTANFILVIAKNSSRNNQLIEPSAGNIIFGMKVSRKVGNAVIRNKIKRRARHLIRTTVKVILTSNLSIIFIPRKPFVTTDFCILANEFKDLLLSVANLSTRHKS